jgi:hypothetical protein
MGKVFQFSNEIVLLVQIEIEIERKIRQLIGKISMLFADFRKIILKKNLQSPNYHSKCVFAFN